MYKIEESPVLIAVLDNDGNTAKELHLDNFSIKNPYNINIDSVFLPNTEPLSLTNFFDIAQRLILSAQETEAINEESIVSLIEEYPPESIASYGNEVITFRVIERKPGMMNKKGTGRPQRKAMFSHEEARPQLANKIITVESRPIDHIIEFNCWALSNKLANKRVLWLEKLFINSAFVFEVKGAERFHFKERLADNYMTINGQRLFSRPLRFFLRYREFDAKAVSIIKQILIDAKILPHP
jgi:hypothetical protein